MSFTGNAIYAELYPSRPSGGSDLKLYKVGAVFLFDGYVTADKPEFFMLTRVHGDGLILACINDGNHWSDFSIPYANDNKDSCTTAELLKDFSPWQDRFKFVGMAKDVLGCCVSCRYVASGETA